MFWHHKAYKNGKLSHLSEGKLFGVHIPDMLRSEEQWSLNDSQLSWQSDALYKGEEHSDNELPWGLPWT